MQTQAQSTELVAKVQAARAASRQLARLSTAVKNKALENIARALEARTGEILEANSIDYAASEKEGLSEAMLDRLLLTQARLEGMAADVLNVAALPDPVGESFDARTLPNGLQISRRRVPLGVIASVYESRPNVTVDISALCIKSGNACVLRGGHEAVNSNKALARLVRDAISDAGVPAEAVQVIESTDRQVVKEMLTYQGGIDLLIPRGGDGLIRFVAQNATIPVVTGGVGVCHTYVDADADLEKALAIVYNAKVQRPTVCNALDTVLVHKDVAPVFLPRLAQEFGRAGVTVHADKRALVAFGPSPELNKETATDADWGKEFLALIAAVKVVDSFEEAVEHIGTYGSGHSEAIITESYSHSMAFLDAVDAAAVYVNASTRFTDGGQFGLGAEVGISTQKMHARGPMGLRELTSYKWVVMGTGQVRP